MHFCVHQIKLPYNCIKLPGAIVSHTLSYYENNATYINQCDQPTLLVATKTLVATSKSSWWRYSGYRYRVLEYYGSGGRTLIDTALNPGT